MKEIIQANSLSHLHPGIFSTEKQQENKEGYSSMFPDYRVVSHQRNIVTLVSSLMQVSLLIFVDLSRRQIIPLSISCIVLNLLIIL